MANPRLRISLRLANGAILAPSKIALLEAIAATGSISAAAQSVHISYRAAWQWVKSINDMLGSPAVLTETVGKEVEQNSLLAEQKWLRSIGQSKAGRKLRQHTNFKC
jgi:molybdate transport repressor ModE-like protein